MRLDKFLNCVNIVKRRATAQDMIDSDVVRVNDKVVKNSKIIKVDDTIEITYLNEVLRYRVLKIPLTKNTPKKDMSIYVEEL